MKRSLMAVAAMAFAFSAVSADAASKKSGTPKTHYSNEGGYYQNGKGSSHKGGHYKNTRTRNRYTKHPK
jgi:hypothetical protein